MADVDRTPSTEASQRLHSSASNLPIPLRAASSCFSICTKIVQFFFPPDRTVIHKIPAAPFHFPNPLSNPLKIRTPLANIGRRIAQKSCTPRNNYFVPGNNDRSNRVERILQKL